MNNSLKELKSIYDGLRSALQINKNELDDEISRQSVVFQEVCEAQARAVSIRDEFKTSCEEQYAISSSKIRIKLEKSGERFTEAQIKESVATDKEYLDATADYLEAKKIADLLGGLRDAYDMRGKMLRELSHLFVSGYWSSVQIKGAASDSKNAAASLAKEAMTEKRKFNRR